MHNTIRVNNNTECTFASAYELMKVNYWSLGYKWNIFYKVKLNVFID